MKFTIEITELENAAFTELNMETELGRILRVVADKVENGGKSGKCMDINGNKVGAWAFGD